MERIKTPIFLEEQQQRQYFSNKDNVRTPIQFRREILCSFKLVLQRRTRKEIAESSRIEFLEKFSGNNFAQSGAEDNTFGPSNRRGIADLPFLRTLLAICEKSQEPNFWEVMDSCFISVCKFGSFKNFMQRLLVCLNFTSEAEEISFLHKRKK